MQNKSLCYLQGQGHSVHSKLVFYVQSTGTVISETDKQTDRQTERDKQTDTETDKQTDTLRDRERQIEIETDRQSCIVDFSSVLNFTL